MEATGTIGIMGAISLNKCSVILRQVYYEKNLASCTVRGSRGHKTL